MLKTFQTLWRSSKRPCLAVALTLTLLLTGCGGKNKTQDNCQHEWQPATCTEPVTCRKCGKTQGQPAGHTYSGKSCTGTDVCAICGAVIQARGHEWIPADCTHPKTCAQCGAVEGEPAGHKYVNGTCSVCGDVLWSPLERSGTGDAVLDDITIGSDFYKVHFTYTGTDHFEVKMKDATYALDPNKDPALLVYNDGPYDGTVMMYGASPIQFQIRGAGDWSYRIDSVATAEAPTNLFGNGDFVSDAAPFQSGVYHVTHNGTGAFYIDIYNPLTTTRILAPVEGPYDGTLEIFLPERGNTIFEVHASGGWSISLPTQ